MSGRLRRRAPELLALALLLAVTALCCWPAIDAPFTFDETGGLTGNRALRPGAPIGAALAYRFSPDQIRPLFFLSLWADTRLFGLSPRPFRATNLALHLLCGLLLYLLFRRLRAGPALAGTALFLLHPLQSESVIYSWGRSEVLSTLLALAALLLVPAPRTRRLAAWGGALLCVALALAAKEEAVVLPLVAFIWWTLAEVRTARTAARDSAVLALPVALFILIRVAVLGAAGRQVFVRSVADNILGQAVVTLRMARLLILPVGQSVDHPAVVPSLLVGLLALAACLAGLAGAGILARFSLAPQGEEGPRVAARRAAARLIAAGILIAAAGSALYWLVPLPDLMSERRAYLPMVGAALALAGLATRTEQAAVLPAGLVVLLLAPALAARARLWSDPQRLWQEAARLAPAKARPLINLGVIAAESGRRVEAAGLFERAVALEPSNGDALFNRAKLRLDAGDIKGALADLETAARPSQARVIIWINLGIARIRAGDMRGAEEALRTALDLDPGEPRALANLAEVLRATGRLAEALPLYHRAMESDPGYAYAAIRLGVALQAAGDLRGALAAYREGLARNPATPADRDAVLKKVEALEAALASAPPAPAPPPR